MAGFAGTKKNFHTVPGEALQTYKDLTASATFDPDDVLLVHRSNSSSSVTLTLPADADANVPVGAIIKLIRYGSGAFVLAAGSGASIVLDSTAYEDTGPSLAHRYAVGFAEKIAANIWLLSGNLTAQA